MLSEGSGAAWHVPEPSGTFQQRCTGGHGPAAPPLQAVFPVPFLGWADWGLLRPGCGALLSILS